MSELEDIWKKGAQELLTEYRNEIAQLKQRISSLERELGASDAALIWFYEHYGLIAPKGDEHADNIRRVVEAARRRSAT